MEFLCYLLIKLLMHVNSQAKATMLKIIFHITPICDTKIKVYNANKLITMPVILIILFLFITYFTKNITFIHDINLL